MQAAFARLEAELAAIERAAQFAVFRDYYLAGGPEPDYRTLAARHGITTTDVSNWLQPHLLSGLYIEDWVTRVTFRLWPPGLR